MNRTIKATQEELYQLNLLKQANRQLADAKKAADNAKAAIHRFLNEQKGIDLNTLEIGSAITIQVAGQTAGVVQIGKQNKFDETLFSQDYPDLYKSYKRDKAVKKFNPFEHNPFYLK